MYGGRAPPQHAPQGGTAMSPKTDSFEYIGPIASVERTDRGVLLKSDNAIVSVTFAAPGVARVRAARGHAFPPDFSWAVCADPQPAPFEFEEDGACVSLSSDRVSVTIERNPFRVVFEDEAGVINEDEPGRAIGWRGQRVRCCKTMPADEHYYGFGEKLMRLDRRRKRMTMWNTDAGLHHPNSDPLYVDIPFYIGHRAGRSYGIFFDSTWKSLFNMGGTALRYAYFQAEGGEANYYFIAGPDMKTVVRRYTELTGRSAMPPLWSLGHHQCRWSYKTDERVRRIASGFRKRAIPCDAMWLDIHYMNGYRVFTWHPRRFPDPRGLIRDLAADGFRTIVIVDPGVKKEPGYSVYDDGLSKDYFLRRADGTLFTGIVWPGTTVFPDFNREEVRDWWTDLHKGYLAEDGVAGIWNDMNEPSVNIRPHRRVTTEGVLHHDPATGGTGPHLQHRNAYGLTEAMATHAALLKHRPGQRPFLLTRSGYAGIQRYAAIWCGDNTSAWSHLRYSVPQLLGLGLCGVPFTGCDIGGFALNCSAELYARWIQLGALYPFCRTHSMLMTRSQEPWSFGERVTRIARRYITLRYTLIPYLYNLFREHALTGLPPMRPLVLEFPDDDACAGIDDQFLLGSSLLAAPVLEKGARRREVYLPQGEWIDYWTGHRYPGPCTLTLDAPLEIMPLFIRAGSIIPGMQPMQHTGERPVDPLILELYPGEPGGPAAVFDYYEDDGQTLDYQTGAHCTTHYACEARENGGATFTAAARQGAFAPAPRMIELRFHGVSACPAQAVLDGAPLDRAQPGAPAPRNAAAWDYDPDTQTATVTVSDTGQPFAVELL